MDCQERVQQHLLCPIPVIRRTLLEWKSLRYGDGEGCIPEWAADRLAAVARACPLGGEAGSRILSHGRREIRAGQVVGILAAKDCILEILPKIDFGSNDQPQGDVGRIRQQLVHMLAVALDLDIASGAVTDLGWQRENLLEILIGLYTRKLADAVREGMPRRYLRHEEDMPVVRGGLNVVRQFTTLAASPGRLACRYDALSRDVPLNQIMKAAIGHLSGISRSSESQRRLRELAFAYADITDVPTSTLAWKSVVLDRTNARWRELLGLAKLLLGSKFQTTSSGEEKGFSLLFEMNRLFEEYVARMLKRALAGSDLTVHAQGGGLYCLRDAESEAQLFMTRPDILIKDGTSIAMIIDTKWKRLGAQVDDPKQGVSQVDVYQMMAYGQLYKCRRLMLLYPHHALMSKQGGILAQHRVAGTDSRLFLASIDVSTNAGILDRLHKLAFGFEGVAAA